MKKFLNDSSLTGHFPVVLLSPQNIGVMDFVQTFMSACFYLSCHWITSFPVYIFPMVTCIYWWPQPHLGRPQHSTKQSLTTLFEIVLFYPHAHSPWATPGSGSCEALYIPTTSLDSLSTETTPVDRKRKELVALNNRGGKLAVQCAALQIIFKRRSGSVIEACMHCASVKPAHLPWWCLHVL